MDWTLVNWCPQELTFDVNDSPETRTSVWDPLKPWLPILFEVLKVCGGNTWSIS